MRDGLDAISWKLADVIDSWALNNSSLVDSRERDSTLPLPFVLRATV